MSIFRPTIALHALCMLFIVVAFFGCKKTQDDESLAEGLPSAELEAFLPYPTDAMLTSLGPKSGIDIPWSLPDTLYIVAGQPKKFLESPLAAAGASYLSESIVSMLGIPFSPLLMNRVIQSTAPPAMAIVSQKQNDGTVVPRQVVIARRCTILFLDQDVTGEEALAPLLDGSGRTLDSTIRKVGDYDIFDLTPPNFPIPQKLGVYFSDPRTVVVVEGEEKDLQSVFGGVPIKNAALDRLKHLDLETCELALAISVEANRIDPRFLEPIFKSNLPHELAALFTKNLRALTLTVNFSAPMGATIFKARYDARDAQGASSAQESIQGLIIAAKLALLNQDQTAKLPIPADFASSALDALFVEVEDDQLNVVLNHFEGFEKVVSEMIDGQQKTINQIQMQQARRDQFVILHQAFMAYYQKHQAFPSDIQSEDGTPLLSWRVAMLPVLGLENLYKKFKLDEPWDGPTNKPLLNSMPNLFQPLVSGVEPPKTVVRFFSSEGTPFSRSDLKIEDMKQPQTTLMFVSVLPEHAVNWTCPEPLVFDPESLESVLGTTAFGISFAGQPIVLPVFPASDARSQNQTTFLEAIVKGMPLPIPSSEGNVSLETNDSSEASDREIPKTHSEPTENSNR